MRWIARAVLVVRWQHSVTAGKWLEANEHIAVPPHPHGSSQLAGKSFSVRSTDADGLDRPTLEKLVIAAGGTLAPKRSATHLLVARRDIGDEAAHADQEAVDQQWLFNELIECHDADDGNGERGVDGAEEDDDGSDDSEEF